METHDSDRRFVQLTMSCKSNMLMFSILMEMEHCEVTKLYVKLGNLKIQILQLNILLRHILSACPRIKLTTFALYHVMLCVQ